MRVGFISQWFPPESGSAALPGTITGALSENGCDVEVVTAYPNYPEGSLQVGWRQRWTFTEHFGQVAVHRTPIYVSHDERAWRRMSNYISFAVSATATSLRRLRKVDVVWVHGTPALAALPAMILRRLFGIPYVLHIQDLWPDTVLASGMLPRRLEALMRRPLSWFCNYSYSLASVVGVIAPGMREVLVARGVPVEKIVDIPNWADESVFYPVEVQPSRKELGLPHGFLVMYAGAIGDVQGLETLLRAAALLRDRPDIRIVLVGDGVARARLESLAEDLGLQNVHFVGPRPLAQMSETLASGDVQIVCLKDLPLYRITLPSKVQATLAAGRPMIVSAGGDAGHVALAAGAGVACPPGDEVALASAVLNAVDASPQQRQNWSNSGIRYYEQHFSQQTGARRMLEALVTAYSTRKNSRST